MLTFSQMFCSCRGVSLSQELCCTQLARLFAREHSNREKRVKFDQGFTVHSAIHWKRSACVKHSASVARVNHAQFAMVTADSQAHQLPTRVKQTSTLTESL